jgi:hypothetical protein
MTDYYNPRIFVYRDFGSQNKYIYTVNTKYMNDEIKTSTTQTVNLERAQNRFNELSHPRRLFNINGNVYFDFNSVLSDLIFKHNGISYLDVGCADGAITSFIGAKINKFYKDAEKKNLSYKNPLTIVGTDIINESDVKFSDFNKINLDSLSSIEKTIIKDNSMGDLKFDYIRNNGKLDELVHPKKFNLITAFESLHHIDNSAYDSISQLDECLMDGGIIIIREHDVHPNDDELKNWIDEYHRVGFGDETVKKNSFTYLPKLVEVMSYLNYQKIAIMIYKNSNNKQHIYYSVFRKNDGFLKPIQTDLISGQKNTAGYIPRHLRFPTDFIHNLSLSYAIKTMLDHKKISTSPRLKNIDASKIESYMKDNSNRAEYEEGLKMGFDNFHWGQLKLLISELQLIIENFEYIKSNNITKIIYVGSANGIHIPWLSQLCEQYLDIKFVFILIDGAPFEKNVWEYKKETNDERIFIYNTIMSSKLTEKKPIGSDLLTFRDNEKVYPEFIKEKHLKKDNGDYEKHIFISDLRVSPIEYQIEKDSQLQTDLVTDFEPYLALLKFRIPFLNTSSEKNGIHTYNGDMLWPVFGNKKTTETRLVVYGKNHPKRSFNIKFWDLDTHEKKCFYFNSITRNLYYSHNIKCPGLCHCFDCSMFVKIFYMLIDKASNLGLHTRDPLKNDDEKAIEHLLFETTSQLSGGRLNLLERYLKLNDNAISFSNYQKLSKECRDLYSNSNTHIEIPPNTEF